MDTLPNIVFLSTLLVTVSWAQLNHYTGTDESCQFTVSISKRKMRQCEQGALPASESIGQVCAQYLNITSNQQAQLELLSRKVLELEKALNNYTESSENRPDEGGNPVSRLGTTYVRWGRTECPNTATLLYEGIAAKSYFTHAGGGSNYLCLPFNPEWPDGATTGFQSLSYIYGVEYQEQAILKDLLQQDAPCAVCQVHGRGQMIMIPAKKNCPAGWTKEYSGLLVSEKSTHTKASYECLDDTPEVRLGGAADTNGGLFYVVEADCGYSLPCPPYIDGYELSCVVCTL